MEVKKSEVPEYLKERALHERVAKSYGHQVQCYGIVGWFYRLCVRETIRHLDEFPARTILEGGCGEGLFFKGSSYHPIQMDVSWTRLQKIKNQNGRLICADLYTMPFRDNSVDVVLLIAVLEHTRKPEIILKEAYRVLKKGGRVFVLVPNDLNMTIGRMLLLKWPPRYPDHVIFTKPCLMHRLVADFEVIQAYPLPFRKISFWLNMFYYMVLEKRST